MISRKSIAVASEIVDYSLSVHIYAHISVVFY